MRTVDLCGEWKLRILGENVYGIGPEFMPARVPGSVYGTLLELGKMPDPYYRDNELTALRLMENDFEYVRSLELTREMLDWDAVLLCFEGLDTLADIYLDDTLLGKADNMHRVWEYSLKGLARPGVSRLRVVLHSPTRYIRQENEKIYAGGSHEAMEGYPHLRKAHCMFGWDWGPRLPDAGIFRRVSLKLADCARLESVYVTQHHEMSEPAEKPGEDGLTHLWVEDKRVRLEFRPDVERFRKDETLSAEVTLTSPEGKVYSQGEDGSIVVEDPKLWWPNGYGEQPLYRVCCRLLGQDGRELDRWERRIGLRTVTMDTRRDPWGQQFAHQVNGVDLFAMGADYIPEDNLLSRVTPERTRRLLEDCRAAHYNCIRVWGGGYYPDDFFFDICDELGLLVWQDLMFACSSYELDEAFEKNISVEAAENIRRIRHHACLGLWCGNNEMETQVFEKAWKPSQKQFYDYIKIFEYILPKIVKREDPNAFYWPSSPSSGGNFDNPWDESRGDTHYWDVWHGNKPFTEYRKYRFRFLSEFGFQSFPCLKTVETYTLPGDRNIFSRIMEMHQRNRAANGKILNYLSATYRYPKDFDSLLYASQLLQAEAIRYGVEDFRRYRGQCMGAVVWQLNDIWPVASWSSIDYFGRWKALHYAEKRMFAPVLLSCEETGELSERPYCIAEPAPIRKAARLCLSNETMTQVRGRACWELRSPAGEVLVSGQQEVEAGPLSSVWLEELDFSEYDELGVYFSYRFVGQGCEEGGDISTVLFTAPKHFPFADPQLVCTREGNRLTVTARAYARLVEIQGVDGDVKLSDNYFDMNPGSRSVVILEGDASDFRVRSVYDIAD